MTGLSLSDNNLLLMIMGPVLALLLSIIAFFLKKIDAKLDMTITKEECKKTTESCRGERRWETALAEERRNTTKDKIDGLIEGFDSLCRCLKTFTKGECP